MCFARTVWRGGKTRRRDFGLGYDGRARGVALPDPLFVFVFGSNFNLPDDAVVEGLKIFGGHPEFLMVFAAGVFNRVFGGKCSVEFKAGDVADVVGGRL